MTNPTSESAKPVTRPVCPWCGQFNWQEDQFNHYDAPHKAYSIICDTQHCGYQTATFKTIAEAWASIAPPAQTADARERLGKEKP